MIIAFIRTILLYLILIVAMRMMGKRQIGQLEPSELVVAVLLSELAAVPMQDMSIPLLSGVIPIITLLSMELLLSSGVLRSRRFRTVLCGRPSIIIEKGKILEGQLKRNQMTLEELLCELRVLGISDPATVEYAILETNGKISALLFPAHRPVTTEEAGKTPALSGGLPMVLVGDGKLYEHNRQLRGVSRQWVEDALKAEGISEIRDVFLMLVDETNGVYLIPREVEQR